MVESETAAVKRASIGAKRNPASQNAILDAAEAILNEEGLAGFSIEAVARRARAGKPTIYRWWPTKTALLLDVYQRFKNTRPFPDTGSLEGDLKAFLTNQLIGFWHGRLCGTVFRSIIAEAQGDDDAAQALFAYERGRRKFAEQIIERAKARGEVSADFNSAVVIELLAGFAWHRLLTGRLNNSDEDIDAVVAMIMAAAKNGLRS
ncbi:TetR/AcrR family transcriptional regulator [Pelagibacterium sp. 26DY04]|uniref:TetR/AcrR family transcriptional regulator n=1 Tax=Pelagibacterium sp. 26DY04 TaxID=2967130 RepID=UPI0028164B08|nr:TetR/AcrR family transcriptional regulator [Pelagibacterium sp. 26DY04]WMT86595.1 TetR/AcrR family transcriptional regulator [Pelagibacterium sp. 26DY04]